MQVFNTEGRPVKAWIDGVEVAGAWRVLTTDLHNWIENQKASLRDR